MKLFAALLIIVLIAFSGYHMSFRSVRLPLFTRSFYMTGIEYLLLGVLIGPFFFNLLDANTLQSLAPLSALLLGWVGLICGFQFEWAAIRRYPRYFLFSSLLEILVTFALIFICLFLALPYVFGLSGFQCLAASIGLAAAATCTAQTGLALLTSATIKKRSYLINYLRYLSSMSSIGALFLFSVVFIFSRDQGRVSGLFFMPSSFSAINVFIANMVLLLLFNLFLTKRKDTDEIVLLLIGMVILTSGAATSLGFSPLLANFLMGVILVNTRREKDRLFDLLILAEKPLYLLLLVFLGASWSPGGGFALVLALLFVGVQLMSKASAGFLVSRIQPSSKAIPPYLGLGLMEQGGVSLAIYYELIQSVGGSHMNQWVGIALVSLIIGDLISPHLMGVLLQEDRLDITANKPETPS